MLVLRLACVVASSAALAAKRARVASRNRHPRMIGARGGSSQRTCRQPTLNSDRALAMSWPAEDDRQLWAQLGHLPRTAKGYLSTAGGVANIVRQLAGHYGRTETAIKSRLQHLDDPTHAAYARLHGTVPPAKRPALAPPAARAHASPLAARASPARTPIGLGSAGKSTPGD